MATRYVGPGGNDGNSGLTYALRKLTLTGIEDTPVVAGDVCYAAPGVYRELLTVDVSGAGGNPITYIADVTGEHTDGVGGICRITGSDDDQTAARTQCIAADTKDYRTFRGFSVDTASSVCVDVEDSQNWIIEDCALQFAARGIRFLGADVNNTIRRCLLFGGQTAPAIHMKHTSEVDNSGHLIENCIVIGASDGVNIEMLGDMTIRNCLFGWQDDDGIDVAVAPNAGHPVIVENCIITGADNNGIEATGVADVSEDYNTFYGNNADRDGVNVGANSETYPPLFLLPILHAGASQASGFKFPWWLGKLSEWSQIRAITGSSEPSVDLLGIARPVTASKNSWGPVQFHDMERETGTVRTGSASLVLHDAGRHQIWVPVTATSTTISVYVYREANYAGNLPRLIVKQPGQADDITTDAAAAGQWNLLTTTLTPAADPPYVVVELASRNTAVALAFKTFFDDLVVN